MDLLTVGESSLPEFQSPPVNEVALSVQFEALERLVVPELGLLWKHYGERFPHIEQHPTLDSYVERYGMRRPRTAKPEFKMVADTPLPRIWFLTEDKKELLQVQNDRFVRNWRRLDDEDEYPRYEDHIRPSFLADLKDFSSFIADKGIGVLKPNQCEVTYTNTIQRYDCWETHADIDGVLSFWRSRYKENSALEIEDARIEIKHVVRDEHGEFLGRLYLILEPLFKMPEDEPIFGLKLICRGRPLSPSIDGVMDFLDLGRAHIVRTFAEATSDCLHGPDAWNRTR